jgi:hypothetical protein
MDLLLRKISCRIAVDARTAKIGYVIQVLKLSAQIISYGPISSPPCTKLETYASTKLSVRRPENAFVDKTVNPPHRAQTPRFIKINRLAKGVLERTMRKLMSRISCLQKPSEIRQRT